MEPLINEPDNLAKNGHYFWIFPITVNLWEEDILSTEDKMALPKVSFLQRFHCTICVVIKLYIYVHLQDVANAQMMVKKIPK